ncbi:MAG: hypothetical protein M0R38_12870 [Bacteroidia bacterium]|nr:hypothetical protein [Bacteroidia bacterium]
MKEALNQPHKKREEKNYALYRIEGLFAQSIYIKSVADAKGRPYVWHYMKTQIDGEDSFIVIREDLLRGTKEFYTIVDDIK